MIRPIRILVGGRAARAFSGRDIPVDDVVVQAVTSYLKETLPNLNVGHDCSVDSLVRAGDPRLFDLVRDGLANDTISCCATWPRTPLENAIFDAVQYLNGDLLSSLPLGEDVKVSGYRLKGETHMIVAAPLLALKTHNLESYKNHKHELADRLSIRASATAQVPVRVIVNAADDLPNGKGYLTLTGTSAEMADDGSVGRGNRPSGLTAPFRPSTTPAAGKNPISHPGKVYNILAQRMAQAVVDETIGVSEARITLFTAIGRPLKTPTLINIAVRTAASSSLQMVRDQIDALARRTLDQMDEVLRSLIRGYPRMY